MGAFFKPLRRKLGVATLLLACAFAAGWVRSMSISEAVTIPTTIGNTFSICSIDSHFLLAFMRYQNVSNVPQRPIFTSLEYRSFDSEFGQPSSSVRLFGIGVVTRSQNLDKQDLVVFPYWSIVIPLTLLSAYLLFSRPKQPKPPVEQQANA